jgi:hypothetical protein
MDHDLYLDDDVRPEPLVDNHNIGNCCFSFHHHPFLPYSSIMTTRYIGVSAWKMLARFAIACGTIGAGYFAANFYSQNVIGPHYMVWHTDDDTLAR